MKLQLFIRGEMMHEKEFPNIKVDHFTNERFFKKREEKIKQYIRELKKEFFGSAQREVYCQVFMLQESRAYHTTIKIDSPHSLSARLEI